MSSSIDAIFDLEQDIMSCWQVVDDVKLLYYHFGDDPRFAGLDAKAEDEMMNLLLGMQSLYELKFDKMFKTFEKVCAIYHTNRRALESMALDEKAQETIDVKLGYIAALEARVKELEEKYETVD